MLTSSDGIVMQNSLEHWYKVDEYGRYCGTVWHITNFRETLNIFNDRDATINRNKILTTSLIPEH